MSGRRAIRIGLLWHSAGAGNLGIGALTVGNMEAVRLAAQAVGLEPHFTILHFPSDFTRPYVDGPNVQRFDINRRSLTARSGYWATLKTLDCVLDIGAGDSFTDIYGGKRFAFLSLTKELAFLQRKPLLLSPQTIGPFSREPYKRAAARAMKKAFAVVARDPESMSAIKALAPGARAVQSVDVAFRLPFAAPAPRSDGRIHIGVNVSGLLYNGGYSGNNEYGLDVDYAELMRRFIREQSANPNVRVHLVGHVFSERLPVDDDARIADLLALEFPDAVRAPNFNSPSEAKSYIAGLDFLVAGRMHACIAAFSAGVPVVPIAYSRKFSGLFGGVLNYPYQVPVRGMSTEEAFAFLQRCLADLPALKTAVDAGQKVVRPALDAYDAVLRDLFSSIANTAGGQSGPGGLACGSRQTELVESQNR